jgi:hypothetical protein
VKELVPRTHRTVPDKNSDVEEHIERWLEGVILGLEPKPVTGKSQHEYPIGTIYQVTLDLLPSEHISGYEASKYIIGTYHSTCSDDEKLVLGQIQSLVHELDK